MEVEVPSDRVEVIELASRRVERGVREPGKILEALEEKKESWGEWM